MEYLKKTAHFLRNMVLRWFALGGATAGFLILLGLSGVVIGGSLFFFLPTALILLGSIVDLSLHLLKDSESNLGQFIYKILNFLDKHILGFIRDVFGAAGALLFALSFTALAAPVLLGLGWGIFALASIYFLVRQNRTEHHFGMGLLLTVVGLGGAFNYVAGVAVAQVLVSSGLTAAATLVSTIMPWVAVGIVALGLTYYAYTKIQKYRRRKIERKAEFENIENLEAGKSDELDLGPSSSFKIISDSFKTMRDNYAKRFYRSEDRINLLKAVTLLIVALNQSEQSNEIKASFLLKALNIIAEEAARQHQEDRSLVVGTSSSLCNSVRDLITTANLKVESSYDDKTSIYSFFQNGEGDELNEDYKEYETCLSVFNAQ